MGNFDIIFESIYMTENLLAIFMASTHPVKHIMQLVGIYIKLVGILYFADHDLFQ